MSAENMAELQPVPPENAGSGVGASGDSTAAALAQLAVPASGGPAAAFPGFDGDMMARFEALSRAFKGEVQVLLGQEQETAREDLGRLRENNGILQDELASMRREVGAAGSALHRWVAEHQGEHLTRIFGGEDGVAAAAATELTAGGELRAALAAFLEVNAAAVRPEIDRAGREMRAIQTTIEAKDADIAKLKLELAEAQVLKTQEERELIEFQALREKDSEVQNCKIELQQLQAQLEELRTENRQLNAKGSQHEAVVREKSEKIIGLVRQLEQQGEQLRLLSDENNTLRLELGRDVDYLKVVAAPTDPLSYACAAGKLPEDMQAEERRLEEDLWTQATKFPGLAATGGNCRQWCEMQISRLSGLHRSFLHRLHDYRASFPDSAPVEFVTRTQELGGEWTQQEDHMRDADAEFQEAERNHTKKWEEHRLQLTSERDTKVKQLLEQAEHSQSKAEKQLLLHQAKLFGQRIDAQIERAWAEQRKERDLRWNEHQQKKQETRQKLKDESLSLQRKAEDVVSASGRFQDMLSARLAGVEDAWLRNSDKESAAISIGTLKSGDLQACLRLSKEPPELPPKGSQHTGVSLVVDQLEEVLKTRIGGRAQLRRDLEEQSLQQLRCTVDKFVQKEAAQQKSARPGEDDVQPPEYAQGPVIVATLQTRQHRHVADTLRRHFYDFLLVLRIVNLAATWLMPESAAKASKHRDMPPIPAELGLKASREATAAPKEAAESGNNTEPQAQAADVAPDDEAVEGSFLYNSLCQRLLERALNVLSSAHRGELLDLKRAYTSEQRIALQNFCQLEKEVVSQAAQRDLQEYRQQIATRLLADCEYHVCEERKQLAGQVDSEVSNHVAVYKRKITEEEISIVKDRRKWLTDRLVVLQASGAVGPSDRALLQRLREELRACESRIEKFAAEEPGAVAEPQPRPPPARPASAGRRSPARRAPSPRAPSATSNSGTAARSLPPPAEPPAKSFNPSPPKGLPSPRPQEALSQTRNLDAEHQELLREQQKLVQQQLLQHMQQPEATGQAPQAAAPAPAAATSVSSPRQQLAPLSPSQLPLPTFGRMVHSPEFGLRPNRPLYEWPFDTPSAAASPNAGASSRETRSASCPSSARSHSPKAVAPMSPRLRPLDCLLPGGGMQQPGAMPVRSHASELKPQLPSDELLGALSMGDALSAGLSLSAPPPSDPCMKPMARRNVPPLLPPVRTPR